MGVALDATLFIDLARRRPNAIAKVDTRRHTKVIPIPNAYEAFHGTVRARSMTHAALFRTWIARFHVAPLDLASAERAAAIRVELSRVGRFKGVGNVLAAWIALSGNHSLVTRDEEFREIAEASGLAVESY